LEKSDFIPYLAIWAVLVALVIWQTWRNAGSGLVLSYCFQLFLLHWLGAMIHAFPWSDLPQTELTFLGFQQSTHAIVAFAVGSLVLAPWLAKRLESRQQGSVSASPKLARTYIIFGAISYFILAPTIGRLSGFNAVAAVGSQLVVVGCCLRCWNAWNTGGLKHLFLALAPALVIPVVTLVIQGFLSYGIIALSTILIFSAQFFRPRWVLLVAGLAAGYLGLSGYAAYMRDRVELRASVWGGESFSDRIAKSRETLETAEWFDPGNPDHLGFVDGRLNQNMLVGAAVSYLGNTGNFAYGSTLKEALMAMIPRIIWPNKPYAGSGGLVARFTGMEFAEGTSVGVGPVLELYGNCGSAGVWIGFLVLGCTLTFIDVMAGVHLRRGEWYEFVPWFLVGIALLNVSGSFVECTAGAAAGVVLATIVNKVLRATEHHNSSHEMALVSQASR
jgi:hypothetical protein